MADLAWMNDMAEKTSTYGKDVGNAGMTDMAKVADIAGVAEMLGKCNTAEMRIRHVSMT